MNTSIFVTGITIKNLPLTKLNKHLLGCLFFFGFCLLVFTGCKKEEELTPKPINGEAHSLSIMMGLFDPVKADFEIFVSSAMGNSVFDTITSIDKAAVSIFASTPNKDYIGILRVNSVEMPFFISQYSISTDSNFTPSQILGRFNTFSLSGNGFPTFSTNAYSPNITPLTFSGLIDYRLPRDSALKISWNPESVIQTGIKSALILEGKNRDDFVTKTFQIPVDDTKGEITIPISELDKLKDFDQVGVFYARAYQKTNSFVGKMVVIRTLNYSWGTINFKK